MAKKNVDLSIVTGKKDDGVVSFYCYKKHYSFSLLAYEVDDNGKFKLDAKGERIPLYVDVDPEKGTKRRARKTFEFTLMPNIEVKTEHGKRVDYKAIFILHKDNIYYEDLYKFLTAEAKKTESPVWSSDEFNKNEHPEAYAVAEKMSELKDDYEKQIMLLKEENERLKKGK